MKLVRSANERTIGNLTLRTTLSRSDQSPCIQIPGHNYCNSSEFRLTRQRGFALIAVDFSFSVVCLSPRRCIDDITISFDDFNVPMSSPHGSRRVYMLLANALNRFPRRPGDCDRHRLIVPRRAPVPRSDAEPHPHSAGRAGALDADQRSPVRRHLQLLGGIDREPDAKLCQQDRAD
jgi:hypothetical protein